MDANIVSIISSIFFTSAASYGSSRFFSFITTQTLGRVAQAFDLGGVTNTVGAPFFASFAKGGFHGGMRDRFCLAGKNVFIGSIAARPFDKLRAGSCKT
jgi:hypothetical protein